MQKFPPISAVLNYKTPEQGGSESYKWGRHDALDDPNPLTGVHDMWASPLRNLGAIKRRNVFDLI